MTWPLANGTMASSREVATKLTASTMNSQPCHNSTRSAFHSPRSSKSGNASVYPSGMMLFPSLSSTSSVVTPDSTSSVDTPPALLPQTIVGQALCFFRHLLIEN